MCHHAQLLFKFFVEMGSPYVAQAGLEFPESSDPPTSISKCARIRAMDHCGQPRKGVLEAHVPTTLCPGRGNGQEKADRKCSFLGGGSRGSSVADLSSQKDFRSLNHPPKSGKSHCLVAANPLPVPRPRHFPTASEFVGAFS